MTILDKVSVLNNVLNEANQLTGVQKKTGELKSENGTKWPVRIMQGGVVVGIIIIIVGIVLGNYPLIVCGVIIVGISGFGWFWMQELSLLEGLDTYISEIVPIIQETSKFIQTQTDNLKKEKESTTLLKEQNVKFNEASINFEKNVETLKAAKESEISELRKLNKESQKRLEKLEEVEKQLESTKRDLEQEKELSKKIAETVKEQESLNKALENNEIRLKEEKKDLQKEIEKLKQQIFALSKIEKQIETNVKDTSILVRELKKEKEERAGKTESIKNKIEEFTKQSEKLNSKTDNVEGHLGNIEKLVNNIKNVRIDNNQKLVRDSLEATNK